MSNGVAEFDSGEPSRENTTDEDTEDASEPEMIKMEGEESGRSSSFTEKLASLRAQLKQLEDGTDPEYLHHVQEMEEKRDKRLFVAEVFRQYELRCAEDEYEREKLVAQQEFEAKKLELKEYLLNELQEKKKAYEAYRYSLELGAGGLLSQILSRSCGEKSGSYSPVYLDSCKIKSGTEGLVDSFEPKTMVTRKLRRRHYDPLPVPEKRRKPAPLSSLVYVLDDSEVEEDLRVIFKGKIATTAKALSSPVPVGNHEGGAIYEARIEDGKVYYESRWFHRGQHIFIESKEHGQESGIITSISQSEIWVKRLPDNSKLRIYLSQLTKGKYVLKRRSA